MSGTEGIVLSAVMTDMQEVLPSEEKTDKKQTYLQVSAAGVDGSPAERWVGDRAETHPEAAEAVFAARCASHAGV